MPLSLLLVVVFLCCYVARLGIAKKQKQKKHPQKCGSTSGYFLQHKLWLHVPKLLFFLAVLLLFFFCFSLLLKNTIKIGFFDDFEMLIF